MCLRFQGRVVEGQWLQIWSANTLIPLKVSEAQSESYPTQKVHKFSLLVVSKLKTKCSHVAVSEPLCLYGH